MPKQLTRFLAKVAGESLCGVSLIVVSLSLLASNGHSHR